MSLQDPQSPPEPRTRVDAWSAVEGDLLSALRDVAARDGGRQLVGDALTLAEQRQAERHARERADWNKPDPPLPSCKKPALIAACTAFMAWSAAMVLLGAVLW